MVAFRVYIKVLMRPVKRSHFLALLFIPWFSAIAGYSGAIGQSVSIQGIITDALSGQPLVGANVVIADMTNQEQLRGAAAERNGFYGISNLSAGRYLFRVSYVGYITFTDTLDLEYEARLTKNAALLQDDALLDALYVAPDGGTMLRTGGEQRIRPMDISRVPVPAAGGDLASYLQVQPGVISSGDRGGQLFIRGGTSSQNMVLMDGTLIYQPFHIISYYSAFPEELISGVDFYPGGFGARYSSRISSVMDVQTRDGNRQKYQGKAALSPFLAEMYLEGPIKKGRSSWLVSGRRSMIDYTSSRFLRDEHPLRFDSQFLKFSHRGSDNSNCSVSIMRTHDQGRMDFESDDIIKWNNIVIGGRCMALPEQSAGLFELNAGLSYMSNSAGDKQNPELYSDITRFNMDVNITRFIRNIRLEYGGFAKMKWYNYRLNELFQNPREENDVMLGSGVHFEATYSFSEWARIRSGVLLSFYLNNYKPGLEPRLRFTWNPFKRENEEFSASAGIYRQGLIGLSDIRDVSSVFVAWMLSPMGGEQMEAIHAMAGWKQSLGYGFQISFEGYYKRLRHLPVTVWSSLARFNTDLSLADGHIYGSDLRIEYNSGRIYAFAGYGYSHTTYITSQDHFNVWFGEPVQRFHPPHDRRHQFNSMLRTSIGSYQASLRWQLGTGLPFTRPMGFDELIRFDDGLPDVRSVYGSPRIIMEKPYQGRLPVYHRMDVSLERTFTFHSVDLDIQMGVINIYDQSNIFYYDVFTQRQIDQLRFAPYISVKMGTR
jgi:hypothetical protein